MKNKKILITVGIFLCMIVALGLFRNTILKIVYPRKYQESVSKYAKANELEENLIFAVIKAESNFEEKAVSHKNAIGLMQIMEETAKDVSNKCKIKLDQSNIKKEVEKVDNNIQIGTKYLKILLNKYGNKEVAIAAYNAGVGTVDNWIEKGIIKADGSDIEKIPYKETNNYVRKILRNYRVYEKLYNN